MDLAQTDSSLCVWHDPWMENANDGWWRVQATWTVGEDLHSYAPVHVATRAEADQLAAEMAYTLSHFPTLDIAIDFDPNGAPENLVRKEQEGVVHLDEKAKGLVVPRCGAEDGIGVVADDRWPRVEVSRRCPTCAGLVVN